MTMPSGALDTDAHHGYALGVHRVVVQVIRLAAVLVLVTVWLVTLGAVSVGVEFSNGEGGSSLPGWWR